MKYFIDTEFHEYKKQSTVCGVKVGKPIDTIELISIGIVSETTQVCDRNTWIKSRVEELLAVYDNNEKLKNKIEITVIEEYDKYIKDCGRTREYYAICKEFDLKAAWSNELLKENTLKSIFDEYYIDVFSCAMPTFNYKSFKYLINKIGKTKEQIAEEVKEFCDPVKEETVGVGDFSNAPISTCKAKGESILNKPEFYAYYADYDWVAFCRLFGRMIDLPKGFPMYCCDLRQMADDHFKVDMDLNEYIDSCLDTDTKVTKGLLQDIFHEKLDIKKAVPQTNKHNALADARWNKELYTFLNSL